MKQSLIIICFFLLSPFFAIAQDPDIDANEQAAIEDFFRTSELPGEKPVGRRGQTKRVSAPPGAVRVGCVCMDDTPSEAQSIGACSGHGGVRYWLYRTPEKDTVRVLTGRHEAHPHPLDSLERSALVQPKRKRSGAGVEMGPAAPMVIVLQQPLQSEQPLPAEDDFGWPEALGISAGGVSSFMAIRLVLRWAEQREPLVRDALRYLLRHRRRQKARKGREDSDTPWL